MSASPGHVQLALGQCATMACLLEATARKPGNVHRDADFEDVSYTDFLATAAAIGPAIERAAPGGRVGQAVLEAVRAMRSVADSNTYLGTILLLAPLAVVPREQSIAANVERVLATMTADDARDVYEAIGMAAAGGLGRVDEADVRGPAPDDLLAAMRLAENRDSVARQYTHGFSDVLVRVLPWLAEGVASGWPLEETIIHAHVRLMAALPDSLIARKCGSQVSQEAADRAARVLVCGAPSSAPYRAALGDLDFWLRSDDHRRNPGTTADLIAAGLFVALRDGIIKPPFRFYRR
ncbi:MAG: triphosphoribosyl-dephospho-CoA synthase [Pirellulales bacterium]|nr:triphosphoribosyl-dephospho-CoA synthase [Pirellulales bacterium]